MAKTVSAAFSSFRQNVVELDSKVVATARTSRDNLVTQIIELGKKDATFPKLIGDHLKFGSFARHTKILVLDDIDIMIPMNGASGYQLETLNSYVFDVEMKDSTVPVYRLRGTNGYINSTRVLNRFRDELAGLYDYRAAEIHKRAQAVTLGLKSYPWVFDIVPAFPVGPPGGATTEHYLIPDGKGQWIRTDPRKDEDHVNEVRAKHGEILTPTLRLLKYWNLQWSKPKLSSYHFETLALKALNIYKPDSIPNIQTAVWAFFLEAESKILMACPDPKGLGPNLDADMDITDKTRLRSAISQARDDARRALSYEIAGHHESAINVWRDNIFGEEFPPYG